VPFVTRGGENGGRDDGPPELVYGIHPVQELLERRGPEVEKVFVAQGRHARLGRALRAAREQGVPVSHLPADVLARKLGRRAAHQGIAAQVAFRPYESADAIAAAAAADPVALLVLVDRVVDPRNLGAILRTSAAAGVRGVILASESTAGVTATTAKVAAGALELVRVAREPRPATRLAALRKAGFRALALDARGGEAWDRADLGGRIVFVAGGEERGPSEAVSRACDARVTVPLAGGVESLNVAVALGVLLFESLRRRRGPAPRP
jgi:23S rRNA (guanosine2251-2'-O)-methyltransferase